MEGEGGTSVTPSGGWSGLSITWWRMKRLKKFINLRTKVRHCRSDAECSQCRSFVSFCCRCFYLQRTVHVVRSACGCAAASATYLWPRLGTGTFARFACSVLRAAATATRTDRVCYKYYKRYHRTYTVRTLRVLSTWWWLHDSNASRAQCFCGCFR